MPKTGHRIVLTGGPGGGKTTAADLIRRELGECVVIVPEAATLLFKGGFPRTLNPIAQKASQKAIYHVQTNLEEVQKTLYPHRVLLCDRGTVDSAVYWPDGRDNFFSELGTDLQSELDRYDAVIFFESAAVGEISIEGGNPTRVESIAEAIELDGKLKDIWSNHRQFFHIPHQKSFVKKINHAIDTINEVILHLNGD